METRRDVLQRRRVRVGVKMQGAAAEGLGLQLRMQMQEQHVRKRSQLVGIYICTLLVLCALRICMRRMSLNFDLDLTSSAYILEI